ncbi:MAG TPA: hypothetical protein V6D20_25025, partial [Candidatus Obscuribacterales bacterium]
IVEDDDAAQLLEEYNGVAYEDPSAAQTDNAYLFANALFFRILNRTVGEAANRNCTVCLMPTLPEGRLSAHSKGPPYLAAHQTFVWSSC